MVQESLERLLRSEEARIMRRDATERLTRRGFMRRAGAVAIAVPAVSMLLAACGGGVVAVAVEPAVAAVASSPLKWANTITSQQRSLSHRVPA
jgi:hypothetical protein